MKAVWISIAVVAAVGLGLFFYQRAHYGGSSPSEAVRLCAADFPDLPTEQVIKRCTCVIESLEASEEGRAVLKLIHEHRKFLKTIESAASHGSVLDAMNVCGQ